MNKIFCKHKWQLISETVTKSRIEVLMNSNITSIKGLIDPVNRKFIQIVACEKCGKLKRFVESI